MSKHTCDQLGVCQHNGSCPDCEPRPSEQASVNPEAGNVWFEEIGLHVDRLTPFESIAIYIFPALSVVVTLIAIAGATGWIYQTFFN